MLGYVLLFVFCLGALLVVAWGISAEARDMEDFNYDLCRTLTD